MRVRKEGCRFMMRIVSFVVGERRLRRARED